MLPLSRAIVTFWISILLCRVHARHLRAARAEYQRRRGHLDQAAGLQPECDVHVHARHERVICIRHVDFHAHGARLHVDGFRGAGDLARRRRRRPRPVARISAGTPGFCSSPEAACGTSTKMRNGSVCAMRYKRSRGRRAAGRHEIADIDLALRDGAVERRLHLLEFGERAVLFDPGFVERDLRLGRIQPRFRAFVIGLLGLAFLLGHHALGRIAPSLVGRFAELSLGFARNDLRLGGLELRSRRRELGIEFRGLDGREHLPLVDVIADIHQPLAHVAVDARVDRGFEPCRRLPRQHEILPDGSRARDDDVDGRRCREGSLAGIRDPPLVKKSNDTDGDEADDEHHRRDDGASLQATTGILVELRRYRTDAPYVRCRRATPRDRDALSRELGGGECSESGGCIGFTYQIRISHRGRPAAQQPVHRGHEDQGRERGEQQAADHRPPQGGILFAALADT